MKRLLFNLNLALEGVFTNKLRTLLTTLGILFGVASVIAMLSIGAGAKESILEQMKLIGANSIVVESKVSTGDEEEETEESTTSDKEGKKKWSRGLTIQDVEAIKRTIPFIEKTSPELILDATILSNAKQGKIKCIGVENPFFDLNNIQLGEGSMFSPYHHENGSPVCVIGRNIQTKYFEQRNPIGEKIRCNNTWLTIIGVLNKRIASKENLENLGIRDYNSDVYVPLQTALIRFEDRSQITRRDLGRRRGNSQTENYHQLDRLVIQVSRTETLQASADVLARILKRRHRDKIDFEVQVPELLIQQQQKTQETFNFVLAVIAGISLLVGGIGIMNIMLASVLERIKEIGLRRALGAFEKDITMQFLFEAIVISLLGGLIGIVLGIGTTKIITSYADIPTSISGWSIILSFGVAFLVGLVFGLIPAQRAAELDPIKALRSD